MKLALITDAWRPQINGVVTTLSTVAERLQGFGHAVEMFTPNQFRNWPCPTYPEIRLALGSGRQVCQRLETLRPELLPATGPAVHHLIPHLVRRICKHQNKSALVLGL